MIDISEFKKEDVLVALYNNSHPQRIGLMHYAHESMTALEAKEILKTQIYFDYLKGRVIKIDLSGDEFDEWLYDRDNGAGSAQRAIDKLDIE